MLNGSQPDSCLSVPDNCRDSININPPPRPTPSIPLSQPAGPCIIPVDPHLGFFS